MYQVSFVAQVLLGAEQTKAGPAVVRDLTGSLPSRERCNMTHSSELHIWWYLNLQRFVFQINVLKNV